MIPAESHPYLGHDPDAATDSNSEPLAETSYLVFGLADSLYAVQAEAVHFIAPSMPPLPVPTSPAHLVGIVHLRGQVITAIDIKRMLDLPLEVPERLQTKRLDQRLVVLKSQAKRFAIVADRVLGLYPVRVDRIERFEQNGGASDENNGMLEGNFEHDRAVVSILDPTEVLSELTRRWVQPGSV